MQDTGLRRVKEYRCRTEEEAVGSIVRIERYRAPLTVNREPGTSTSWNPEPLSQSCILASWIQDLHHLSARLGAPSARTPGGAWTPG